MDLHSESFDSGADRDAAPEAGDTAARRPRPRDRSRAAPPRDETTGPVGARQAYMSAIQDVALLTREQVNALARRMDRERRAFERALAPIPGTALLLLESWRARRRRGRVSGSLSRHHRDGSGRDVGAYVDACLGRLAALVDARPLPRDAIVACLDEAAIAFGVWIDVHRDLLRAAGEAGEADARRLGVHTVFAGRRLARAERALASYRRAVQEIAFHNLRLVAKCAHRYRNMGVPFMDLVQEGNLGLYRAVEKFDPERGFMFSTYAVWWIQQAMIRAVQNHARTVRLPSHICEQQVRYRRKREELLRGLDREPSPFEVAQAQGIPLEQADVLEASLAPIQSIHAPVRGLEEVSLEEALADEQAPDPVRAIDGERLARAVQDLLCALAPRERAILAWRFGLEDGEPSTLGEIGRRLGLSRERVRQIEQTALARLRDRARSADLRAALDRIA